jgi:phage terminase small subunit
MKKSTVKPPKDLGPAGRRAWAKFHAEFNLLGVHDMERTRLACKCLDDEAAFVETVSAEGRYVTDRWNQKKEHPAAKAARECRMLFCRIVRDMGVDIQEAKETRPPRQY